VIAAADAPVFAQTLAWDKTFPESDRVDHRKVSFYNRLGIELVADLYVAKTIDRSQRHPALVVGGPYGAVKEQSSGLYAQAMAERGYITIAHDPSYVGESGGQPHGIASSEALVEDFSAGVDYLGGLPLVDRERIGVLGVCGSGGFGLAAAEIDPRIKAVATVSMYDIGQGKRQGLAPHLDEGALRKNLNEVAAQRWAEVDGAERTMVIGTPQVLTASSTAIDREFFDYYRTPRGQHPRSTTAFSRSSDAQMMLFWSYQHLDWISPRPVLFITGDRAHSRIFSEHAYSRASERTASLARTCHRRCFNGPIRVLYPARLHTGARRRFAVPTVSGTWRERHVYEQPNHNQDWRQGVRRHALRQRHRRCLYEAAASVGHNDGAEWQREVC
jgi:fermentation-respiration switch protein FrsA (DUF1100 family)